MDWTVWADWAWARHHNELSWHIRPLIILAFCAAAWFRRPVLVVLVGLFFPLSAVVFPAPEVPKPYVVEFLAQERAFLEGMSLWQGLGFVVLVVVFLTVLAMALWRRSFWMGVLVANMGGLIKMVSSLALWGAAGQAVIVPTVLTALVFNSVALVLWWFVLKRRSD